MFPLRRVQREGDAVPHPEVGGQVHHLPAGAGQPGGITIELVPEDGLGLLQSQEDDRILGQVVPFRIGIKPAGGAVVEQGHMGFLHTDGENNQQTEVIKPHLMTEALQLLLDLSGLLRLGEPIYVFPDRIVKHVSLLFRSLILLIEKTFFSYLKWCCDYQRQLFPYLSKKYPVFSARGQENHLIASDPTL